MRDMVLLQLVRARCRKNALLVAQKAGPICHVNNSDEKKRRITTRCLKKGFLYELLIVEFSKVKLPPFISST